MYWRGFATGILIAVVSTFMYEYAVDLINWHFFDSNVSISSADSIEAGPIKVVIDSATDWITVYKMIFTVLTTYLGIKVINRYIK